MPESNAPVAAHYRFPGGRRKALVMSYDDGSEHDRRLVGLFNRFGIRGSFHLNSAKLDQPHFVSRAEVPLLYQGHEVAGHTANHPDLTQLSDDAVRREILDDRHALQGLSGQPVRGLAYPFGTYDERIVRIARELGVAYARTANSTMALGIPEDVLIWNPSCHHSAAMELAGPFLDEAGETIALLYIFGHSYELDGFMSRDPSKDWDYIEGLCQLLHGRDSVWYATSIEVADYLEALDRMEVSSEQLRNVSEAPVWVHWHGRDIELAPGASAEPRNSR